MYKERFDKVPHARSYPDMTNNKKVTVCSIKNEYRKTIKNSGQTKDVPAILDSFIFNFIRVSGWVGGGGGEGDGPKNFKKRKRQ